MGYLYVSVIELCSEIPFIHSSRDASISRERQIHTTFVPVHSVCPPVSGRCAQCLVTAHRQHAVQNTQSRAAAAAVSGDNEITSACQLATVHGNLSRTTIHNASNHRSSSAAMPLSPRYRPLQSILVARRRTTGADY